MRAFLAVDVERPELLSKLKELQQQLLETGADAKAVEEQNLHFTIRFFGEISEQQASQISERLSGLEFHSFPAAFTGVGAFPNLGHINVVWVGVDGRSEQELMSLARLVHERLAGVAPHENREFVPHLTLLRVKTGRNREALATKIQTLSRVEVGNEILRSLRLKKSELTPKGPIYETLKEFPFAGGPSAEPA